jgi:hypothetical protein
MPKKSKRNKVLQSKRKQERRDALAAVSPPPIATQTSKPVARPVLSVPSQSTPAPKAKTSSVRYPYVVAELKRIGILAGIMLVILIVLALVLP